MNKFARNLVFSTILFCIALVFSPYTAMGDTNFPGNVTVTSNLVVKGTLTVSNNVDAIKDVFVSGSLAVTNIGPGQASMSLYLSGADSDDNGDGGKVLISGGAGDFYGDYNGGAVVITGGSASGEGPYGGDVILQGGSGGSHVYPTRRHAERKQQLHQECAHSATRRSDDGSLHQFALALTLRDSTIQF